MRRLALTLAATALATGGLLAAGAPAANACQPEYCPPPPPWCYVPALSHLCLHPF